MSQEGESDPRRRPAGGAAAFATPSVLATTDRAGALPQAGGALAMAARPRPPGAGSQNLYALH
jgi:hypothetical protein